MFREQGSTQINPLIIVPLLYPPPRCRTTEVGSQWIYLLIFMFTDRSTRQTKISFRRPSLLVLLRDSGGQWCRLQQSGKFTSYLYGKVLTVNMRLSTFWRHFLEVQNAMSYLISALISCIPASKLLQKRFGRTVDYVFMLGNWSKLKPRYSTVAFHILKWDVGARLVALLCPKVHNLS